MKNYDEVEVAITGGPRDLIFGDVLMTFIYALAIGSLLYYHKKLEYGYLKLGAIALVFGLLSQLLAGLMLHLGTWWIFLVSLGANLLFTLFMYIILQRLGERQVSLLAIVVTVVASVVCSVCAFSFFIVAILTAAIAELLCV